MTRSEVKVNFQAHHHQQHPQQHHQQSHNLHAARRNIDTSSLKSQTVPASSFSFGDHSGFSLLGGFSGGNGQFAQHLFAAGRHHQNHQQVPTARQVPAALPFHASVQKHLAGGEATLHHQHQLPSATSFIGPAQAPASYSHVEAVAPGYSHVEAAAPGYSHVEAAAPQYSPYDAPAPAAGCPAPSLLPQQCAGAVSTCWSVGVADVDCPGHGLCWSVPPPPPPSLEFKVLI